MPLDTQPGPTEAKRGRGRPRKQTRTKVAFDTEAHGSTIAAIKVIPENRRNAVRDDAIARVTRDPNVRGSHKAIFGKLAMETWWRDGVFLRSNAWLAKECGTSRRNVEYAIGVFCADGRLSRRLRKTQAGDHQTAETTIPLFAQVWKEMQEQQTTDGVPNEKSNFRSVGTEPECGQPSVLASQESKIIGEDRRQGTGTLADASHDEDLERIASATTVDVLTHWRACKFFRERPPRFSGEIAEVMDLAGWRHRLRYYGGAPDLLGAPAAHRQALELAHELRADTNATGWLIMAAIAFWVCKAHREGKRISSLGFIATRLARYVSDGDYAWLFDLPTRIDSRRFEGAVALAKEAVAGLRNFKVPMTEPELLSTIKVELLAEIMEQHTRNVVVAAINRVIEQMRVAGDLEPQLKAGNSIAGWNWFDPYIEACKPKSQVPRMPERDYYEQQRKVIDERNRQIKEAIDPFLAQMEAAGIEVNRRMLCTPAQIGWLRTRLQSEVPAEVLSAAVSRFIADPTRTRTKVSRWSNLGDAITAEIAERRRAA